MKKFIPCLALGLLSQGCVGFGVLKTHTETVRDPLVPETNSLAHPYPHYISKTTNSVVYTSAWLETHWGKPASITHAGAGGLDEIWTYKFGMIWEGIMPIVVVPIPIALPVATEKIRFVLRDGRVVSATTSESQMVGGAVGLDFGRCGGNWRAFSLNDR